MEIVRLKDKGQVTIPASIREEIAAQAGDLFSIVVDGDSIILRPQEITARRELPKSLAKKGVDIRPWIGSAKGVFTSVEEIDEYIRAERDKWD